MARTPNARWKLLAAKLAALAALLSISVGVAADPLDDYSALRKKGRLAEALNVLRSAIADPNFPANVGGNGALARQRFLQALGEHTASAGAQPQFDAEALKVYQDGVTGADAEEAVVLAEGMVFYYSRSSRLGNALPYARQSLEHWLRKRQPFKIFSAYFTLSAAYWGKGEIELSRYYADKAQEVADRHFVRGPWPDNPTEWSLYWLFLMSQMEWAGVLGDVPRIEQLRRLQEPVERIFKGPVSATNGYVAALALARGGRPDEAREVRAKAEQLWKDARPNAVDKDQRLGDGIQLCLGGLIAATLREFDRAISQLESCLGKYSAGFVGRDASFVQLLAFSYEGVGRADDAIAAYRSSIAQSESMRSSFSVSERANFFRTEVRQRYWGLIRALARSAPADRSAFFEALHTSELVRGRQLGELIDPEMSKRISPESLAALWKKLAPDSVVLAYTTTESEVILLAMTRERLLAEVIPYDGKAFAASVRAAASELARPVSSRSAIEARLQQLSAVLLTPVRTLLQEKKRIFVLPDGAMNLIPFELLSVASDAYRPLIDEHVVTALPSMVFLERAARQGEGADLLVLADPRFAEPKSYAGASASETRAATRGERFLSYFASLPETRSEAESIARLFAGQKVDLLVGESAVRSRLNALDLSKYAFLHFATHGVLGHEVPGLEEPALVLGSESGVSGFLTASEASALKLDAELAVLSACNTGSGDYVTGEGVMGMGRAFLSAGSRGVVVSLWRVASKQTEELMVDFYRHLRSGKKAAEALRDAKLDYIARTGNPRSLGAHPYYWAPFILLGG